MKVSKIIAHNIDIIRNNVPYRKFSELIYKKTGVRIGAATLQQYVSRLREPRNNKLEAIAGYAGKSVSWLYEDHTDNYGLHTNSTILQNDLDYEYYHLAKELQDAKIPPDDIRKVLYAIKALKPD